MTAIFLFLVVADHFSLFDFGLLTFKISKIIDSCSSYLAMLVDINGFNEWRCNREYSFYSNIVGYFTNCKCSGRV